MSDNLVTVCQQADQFTPGALLHGPAGFYVQHDGQPLAGPYTADELRGGRFARWAAGYQPQAAPQFNHSHSQARRCAEQDTEGWPAYHERAGRY